MEDPGPDADDRVAIDTDAFVRLLFAGLGSGDRRLHRHGGTLLCELAHADERRRADVIDALVAWAVREPGRDPVMRTLATLGERYSATIRRGLHQAAEEHRAEWLAERLAATRPWDVDFETEENEVATGPDGALRIPRELLQRYADDHPGDREATPARDRHLETTTPGRELHWSRWSRRERLDRMAHGDAFAAVESASRFDEFAFLGPEIETRFGAAVTVRTLDGSTENVAIARLYRQPDDEMRGPVMAALETWGGLADPNVCTLLDWGDRPRPWALVADTERTLWERCPLSSDTALGTGIALAGAVARLHQRDVVHGGIDPHSIRFPPSVFDDEPIPKLDDVGLVPVYSEFDDPTQYVDPRFAAPEYRAARYGNVDHRTDVYQLGLAVSTAFTGELPGEGGPDEEAGPGTSPRFEGASVPAEVADVLARATAPEKLERFETATQFYEALRRCRRDPRV